MSIKDSLIDSGSSECQVRQHFSILAKLGISLLLPGKQFNISPLHSSVTLPV